ncbi:protein LEG1 homolog [Talpa occidentalis]|uniref:protein LEG1 homolog n=1 Tax=Talpa occidentalis TaxID=50954 RepID=UPI0023F6D429|nr:protein LEG1 homolog [Talpa occidentalis]
MWDAHQAAINVGLSKFSGILFYSSDVERNFTTDFLTAIEFCKAAIYRPFFESSTNFLVGYSHRLLMEQDRVILTSNFSIREKALMNAVKFISEINEVTGGAYNISDAYPPLWQESPGQFSDYKIENGNAASPRRHVAPSPLPIHFGWQYHTGRLADPTQKTDCGYTSGAHLCISVDSWWAAFNYYLSAMPFLAAIDSGIMGISSDNVTFLPPSKDQMNFCYNISSCRSSFPEAMKKWNEFYQHVQSHSSSFEDLLKYLWAAHVSSSQAAHKNFDNRLKYYSKQEADFESNWALFVDYLAPPLFPSTLMRTHEFQKGLPTRMLVSGDKGHFIRDFTNLQNIVLFALSFLHKVHKYTGTLSFIVWETVMKLKVARNLFQEILEFSLHYFN